MSFQGKMTGNQAGKLFAAYNEQEGSEIVDLTRNYNTGDKYSNRIGDGNQLNLAFKEINTHRGDDIFGLDHLDWSNGVQLKAAFTKFLLLIGADDAAPVWLASLPLEITITQGEAWPYILTDHSWSSIAISAYGQNLNLPTGIILNANGTFTGTATNSGAGTAEFVATNANGDTLSEWVKWSVEPSLVLTNTLDLDKDGNPDTLLFKDDTMTVTEDKDSFNTDVFNDNENIIVQPKVKKARKSNKK